MIHQPNNQKGQTLLELLIALLILVSVITATTTLIVTSINAGWDSANRLIASSLAREAIEIVRNIRDSNWIDPHDPVPNWDDGLSSLTVAEATPLVSTPGTTSVLYFDLVPEAQVKLNNGAYTQGAIAPGTNTQFYRVLYLNPICHNANNDEIIVSPKDVTGQCGSGSYTLYPNKVGIRVIAEVHWPNLASSKKVLLEDRLYNWQIL